MATPGGGLILRMLGPLEVLVDGLPLPRLRTRAGLNLLALLALRAVGAGNDAPIVTVERRGLAGTLWPDSPDTIALGNLRRTLTDLRGALGSQSFRLDTPTQNALTLDLSGAWIDLLVFDRITASGDSDEQEREEAIHLYRGALLEGFAEDWVIGDRTAREQAFLQLLETSAESARRRGDAGRAEAHLRRSLTADPLRETAWRTLMRVLSERGDYAAATQAYRALREHLRQELRVEPDPATTSLYRQIRADVRRRGQAAEPTETPAAPTPPAPAAPPCRPVSETLPHPLTSLIGRRQEGDAIRTLLDRGRLVTLIGAGGIGKTRLAIAVAGATEGDYEDGVCFLDLSTATEPEVVGTFAARALGLREGSNGEASFSQAIVAHLKNRNILFVWDNCEQVERACAQLMEELLSACPGLRILATSRHLLNVPGEFPYVVPSLAVPDDELLTAAAKTPASGLMEFDAARLFAERATAADPSFAITPRNAAAVARILRRLDGIPLAIELAAARIRLLSAEQIDARLDDRFRLLNNGGATRLRRQQTLRAAIDWSWDLLSLSERSLLVRLSVFAGGVTLDAVESVCGGDCTPSSLVPAEEVLDLLSALVDRSLVLSETAPDGRERRYRLLETVREYAREKLVEESGTSGEADLRNRHLRYFVTLVEGMRPLFHGPEESRCLDALDADHDNLRAALRHASGTPIQARLAAGLQRFWQVRGPVREGREWLEEAIASAFPEDSIGTPVDTWRVEAINSAASMAFIQGDYPAARRYYEQFLALHPPDVSPETEPERFRSVAVGRNNLAQVLNAQREHDLAFPLFHKALEMRRRLGDRTAVGDILGNLGYAAASLGDWPAAREYWEESLEIDRALGNAAGIGWTLCHLGGILHDHLDDKARGQAFLEEALEILRSLGHRRMVAVCLINLGSWACQDGDLLRSVSQLSEGLLILRAQGHRAEMLQALLPFSELALARGDTRQAVRLAAAMQAQIDSPDVLLDLDSQNAHRDLLERLRKTLPPQAFDVIWYSGLALTLDEAVDSALAQ